MSAQPFLNGLSNGFIFGMLTSNPLYGGFCSNPFYNPGLFNPCCYNPMSVFTLPSFPVVTGYPVMPQLQMPALNFAPIEYKFDSSTQNNNNGLNLDFSGLKFNFSLPVKDTTTEPSATSDVGDTFTRTTKTNTTYANQKLGGDVKTYDNLINKYAKEYNVDPNLIKAIMRRESSFDPKASSGKAYGLMQLTPATAKEMGVTDIYNVEQNIKGGVKYFKERCLDARGGNVELALASYNAGPNNSAVKAGKIPQNGETPTYVRKVMQYYKEYSATA